MNLRRPRQVLAPFCWRFGNAGGPKAPQDWRQNATARSAGSWFVQAEELLPAGRRIDGKAAGAANTDDSIGDPRPV